jgi:endonuclease/exonuclease/phosphatase family metal-dependent hydrolase
MNVQSKSDNKIRLASYNVRKCVGLDLKRSPERVLEVVSGLNADVIALQEADKRLGNRPAALPLRLIEAQSDYKPVVFDAIDQSLGFHGNAVLVRKATKINVSAKISLPGLEPRGAVLTELTFNSRKIRIVATHLGLMRRYRIAQLETIRQFLASMDDIPTLILGDFNEWSKDKGLEPLQKDFEIHAPGLSFHAARPVAALDRIAASSDLNLIDAGVCQSKAAQKASDHLPVWADFTHAL